jgi:hypothetical protein
LKLTYKLQRTTKKALVIGILNWNPMRWKKPHPRWLSFKQLENIPNLDVRENPRNSRIVALGTIRGVWSSIPSGERHENPKLSSNHQ